MDRDLHCSFCGKSEHEVSKLVAGPNVFICGACISLAHEIVSSSEPDSKPPPAEPRSWRAIFSGVRIWFGRGSRSRYAALLA